MFRMMKAGLLPIIICSILNSSCVAEDIEYSPLFSCSKYLDKAYGICSHVNKKGTGYEFDRRDEELNRINEVGASFVRTVWDWSLIEEDGNYTFSHYDKVVSAIMNYNKEILAIITLRTGFKMSEIGEWGKYIEKEVDYYKKIKYWEIINEADIIRKWHPNICANEYTELLKRGYCSVKNSNKNANILFTGIANTDSRFLDSVFDNKVGRYFDIMNVHRYSHKKDEPEKLVDYFTRLKEKLVKFNVDKPIWMTECGCSTAEGWASEEAQAQKLPRIFLISFALGVDKVFWYKSRSNEEDPQNKEGYYGLWHKDYSPKPAYFSYKTLVKMCPEKSVRPKLRRNGNVFIAQWTRPDRGTVYAFWTPKVEREIEFYSNMDYNVYDIYGSLLKKEKDILTVSPNIKYIVGPSKLEISIK